MKKIKSLELVQKSISQINFILTRFDLPGKIFVDEINYLLTNSENSSFDSSSFNDKLLARVQYFLILEIYASEPHYFTNEQQVKGVQRLLRILELNNWLKLARKMEPTDVDLWPYHLISKQANSQLQKIIRRFRQTRSSSEESIDLPYSEIFEIYLTNLLSQVETINYLSSNEIVALRAKLDYFRSGRNWFPEKSKSIEKVYQQLGEKLKVYQKDKFKHWFGNKKFKENSQKGKPPLTVTSHY